MPYEVANAEHLAMSEHVGMINLSHFAIFDIEGPDAEALLESLSVARVGGNTPVGRVVYTNFLNPVGGVQADLTICRLAADRYRVVTGGADGNRDLVWIRNARDDAGLDAQIKIRTHDLATLGFWGPKARASMANFVDPNELADATFPFATAKTLRLSLPGSASVDVWALRISYVGEYGWELYFDNDPAVGLPLYDAFLDAGVVSVGIETYATSRRLEKSFRLQGADLETEYTAYESDVHRSQVKRADFVGKSAYLAQRHKTPDAVLCTLTLDTLRLGKGPERFPVGMGPILDAATREVLTDAQGRRSYSTSTSYCPSLGKHAVMSYLPRDRAQVGAPFLFEYFDEDGDGQYPMRVGAVGREALYDPQNLRVRG